MGVTYVILFVAMVTYYIGLEARDVGLYIDSWSVIMSTEN